jgi:hypothetical protein
MKFKPKSEAEIKSANLWPKGEYPFEIMEAEEQTDKNGNDMLKLKVAIFNDDGNRRVIFDYVSNEWMAHKFVHLCDACGLLKDYETGELEPFDLVGKTGKAKVGIKIDKTGQYDDSNNIMDYVAGGKVSVKKEEENDDIPF